MIFVNLTKQIKMKDSEANHLSLNITIIKFDITSKI